ncbi:hypothetical protein [Methylorubrum extorquens]|uniref:hypothetical protein n=1 Tax=Methylorubrum extorquens TaxID=408 RepID=UPI002238DA64|nr:hypothetical protein [Methylorubrum extorquens]UYW32534.1 hypothetical protein OKB92_26820 [Methylorubrum extorquens]
MPTDTPTKSKRAKLGAEKLTPEEQKRRFEELAREAGCDESSGAKFEAAVEKIGRAIVKPEKITRRE